MLVTERGIRRNSTSRLLITFKLPKMKTYDGNKNSSSTVYFVNLNNISDTGYFLYYYHL